MGPGVHNFAEGLKLSQEGVNFSQEGEHPSLDPAIKFIGKDYSDLLRIPIYIGFNSFSQIPWGTAVDRIFFYFTTPLSV